MGDGSTSADAPVPDVPWSASPIALAIQRLRRAKHAATQPTFSKSYSYFGEDLYCLQFLPEDCGRYLDIGSGHPVRGSNTYLFYRRGWSGILIDPIKRHVVLSSRKRRRDSIFQGILGSDRTDGYFYEFTPYEISTVSREHAQDLIDRSCGRLLRVDALRKLRWEDLGLTTSPIEPFLLSVDVETTEMDVLHLIDFNAFKPRVICIEDSESPMISNTAIQKFLGSRGYVWAGAAGFSRIMVHDSYLEAKGLA